MRPVNRHFQSFAEMYDDIDDNGQMAHVMMLNRSQLKMIIVYVHDASVNLSPLPHLTITSKLTLPFESRSMELNT